MRLGGGKSVGQDPPSITWRRTEIPNFPSPRTQYLLGERDVKVLFRSKISERTRRDRLYSEMLTGSQNLMTLDFLQQAKIPHFLSQCRVCLDGSLLFNGCPHR